MSTSINYLYVELLSEAPGADSEIVTRYGTYDTGDTLTSGSPTLEPGDLANWDEAGVEIVYTGYTAPDGGPIVEFGSEYIQTYYALSNTLYSSFDPVATAPFMVACFGAGTLILTPAGEVAVEDLAAGGLVSATLAETDLPIRWIGHRRVDACLHPRPAEVNPVRIAADAFGPGAPRRDLVLSPDHCVYVDGVLVPIRTLVNDETISQEDAGKIDYWHVELERHDVLLAEGLTVESYLETGNRHAFSNVPVADLLAAAWLRAEPCARLVETGDELNVVRRRLSARARALRHPDAPGQTVEITRDGHVEATIPAGVTHIELVSACATPQGERRRLGACIGGVTLDGVELPLQASAFRRGFHAIESRGAECWRWTDGAGVLELLPDDSPRLLSLRVRLCAAPAEMRAS